MSAPKSSAPRTKREWAVYRAGVLEGVDLAQANASGNAELFKLRVQCSGVKLSTPAAPVDVKRRGSA